MVESTFSEKVHFLEGKKLKDAQSSLEATKEQSVALSLLAAKEAKVAFLEALDAQMEYDEKYGEEE